MKGIQFSSRLQSVNIKISQSCHKDFLEKWNSKFAEETSMGIVDMGTHVTLDMR